MLLWLTGARGLEKLLLLVVVLLLCCWFLRRTHRGQRRCSILGLVARNDAPDRGGKTARLAVWRPVALKS